MKQLNLKDYSDRQKFYQSTEWRKLRAYKINNHPLCEECLKKDMLTPATEVHHIKDIVDCPTFENALNYDGLMSLCKSCHSTITQKKERAIWKPFNMKEFLIQNRESDTYPK